MKTIGVYYRVSTSQQDLDSQEHAIKQWLDALPEDKKPKKVIAFKDEGISGKTDKRPGYVALMEAAKEKKIDTIVVYKLDRFSRDATTAIRTILDLDGYGVAFVSVTQQALNLGHDNPFRRTFLALFADLAEIERETIVARVKAGLAAAKARGVRLGNQKIIPEGAKAQVIELRSKGESFRSIAKKIDLSPSTVHKLYKNKDAS